MACCLPDEITDADLASGLVKEPEQQQPGQREAFRVGSRFRRIQVGQETRERAHFLVAMHRESATEGHTSEHVANPRSISNRFWQSRAVSRRNVSQPESTMELAPPGSRKSQVDHAPEVDRSFEETGTTTNRHRLGRPRQPIREEILRRDERDAELVEAATDVLVHKVFRAHMSSRSLVFPGHPDVVPRMPSFVVFGGLHVFPKPPTDHSRRDIRHSSEYCDVKGTVGQSLDPAEIRQLLGRQKRGEFVELHDEVAELTTERAPHFRHGPPPHLKMRSCWDGGRQAASRRSPSQSVRNPATEFQLGVMRDAGPEIASGLGAFLYAARSEPGFGRAFFWQRPPRGAPSETGLVS